MRDNIKSICPHCPGSSRQYVVPRGLNVHISRVHGDGYPRQPPSSAPALQGDSQNAAQVDPIAPSLSQVPLFRRNVRVLKHVPKGARCLAANKLSQIMEKCVQTNNSEDWYELLTFSFTSLRVPSSDDRKQSLTSKVKKNINDGNSINLSASDFATGSHSQRSLYKAVEQKVNDGDLSGAVRILLSDSCLADDNQATLDILRQKHPSPGRPLNLPGEPDQSSEFLSVEVEDVSEAIASFKNGSAGGLDGLRPEHLKELTSFAAGDGGVALLHSICNLVNFMMKGMVNRTICPFLYGASLCALKKRDGGIRPIAVGSVIRRLVAKLCCRALGQALASELQPHQLGFGVPLGSEAAIHATRSFAMSEARRNDIIVKVDVRNAFNSIERDVILSKVKSSAPNLYPFVHQCYSSPSNLFYGVNLIESQVGVQQGDPLGPLLFSLAVQDVIASLHSPLNIWYLDDGTIGGSPEVVIEDLKILVEGFGDLGLRLNSQKCELFSCSGDVPQELRSELESVIPGVVYVDKAEFTLLGAPIFPEGIPAVLMSKLNTLLATKPHLKHLSAHVALTILRGSLSMPRLTYSLRTAPVWRHGEAASQYDKALKELLECIINIEMTPPQWDQAALPIRHGGLGVRRLQDTELPAFLASSYGVIDLVIRILNVNGDEFKIPYAEEALDLWRARCPASDVPQQPECQRSWDEPICKITLNGLIGQSVGSELARLRAAAEHESGLWLHALPSPQLGTLLDNDSLRVAVALRLGCNICEPHRCVCGAWVDAQGHHGLYCVRSAGRFSRHHSINDIIRRALASANIPSVLEPPGLSRTDGKRPDGLTLVPWERGRCLLWDATCVCTFAQSHVAFTAATAGAAAEAAARQKCAKYRALMTSYIFVPLALETTGVWGTQGRAFIKELGRRLRDRGHDKRSGAYLMQRISLAVQRGNAASVMGTFGSGFLYYVYMGMLAVFCTNAINILAGINGLEVGQAVVIALSIISFNVMELRGDQYKAHQFSLYIMLPYLATTLALLKHNWYPSKVFVGDTFCYVSGMTFAVVGILSHFSKTVLLFFIPQVINFLYSVPQIFHIIPCPRHRLPKYNGELDILQPSRALIPKQDMGFLSNLILKILTVLRLVDRVEDKESITINNLTIINLFLIKFGDMTENKLTISLLSFQVACSCVAFLIRYPMASYFYDS
ncbi:unnamed protein product [Plutella xylostella]|uniref:UDP-N-acetylglucosamine--dolichyl-phosphate N-acetylglucosaminephosphotransferase n=1 Tax=Plutella xylostella TaxID=51655 RepID=A0A8S4G8K5_PLUXY|nr:unnamed protein product [Plutella xylostella]